MNGDEQVNEEAAEQVGTEQDAETTGTTESGPSESGLPVDVVEVRGVSDPELLQQVQEHLASGGAVALISPEDTEDLVSGIEVDGDPGEVAAPWTAVETALYYTGLAVDALAQDPSQSKKLAVLQNAVKELGRTE